MAIRRIVGIVLIVIGLVALATGGVFWTRRDKVIDAGPIEVTADKHEGFSLPPVVGILALVGGIVLVALPGRVRA